MKIVVILSQLFLVMMISYHSISEVEANTVKNNQMIVKIETFTPDNLSDIYLGEWKVRPAEIFGTLWASVAGGHARGG